jgi:hypothetical protein
MKNSTLIRHKGPNLGLLAIIFTLLFNTGLSFVISLNGTPPYFPGPWEPTAVIVKYFQNQQHDVLMCAFFQFCSAIPLGIFTATIVSRIWFLGSKAAGNNIALLGGFFTAFNLALSAMLLWVMAFPKMAADENTISVLYYMGFIIGGVGYSVPLGLLIGGISIQSWFMKTLPKWLTVTGFILMIIGELSCLDMISGKFLPLIPLTRFPGFIWLIIAGLKLPKTKQSQQ